MIILNNILFVNARIKMRHNKVLKSLHILKGNDNRVDDCRWIKTELRNN